MDSKVTRGSEKLMAAWKARTLTEESVREIAQALDKSPATVEGIIVVGGSSASGLQVTLRYDGDDVPWCGNDISFWLAWLRKHGGGVVHPPKVIINGTPWPDLAIVELGFGNVNPAAGEVAGPVAAHELGAMFG